MKSVSTYFQVKYERYQKRKDSSLPNKCDLCGLKIHLPEQSLKDSEDNEQLFKNLRELQRLHIINQGFPRTIAVGSGPNYVEYCAVNSRQWNSRNKKCPYFQLKNYKTTLSDYLSIHHSIRNKRIAIWVGIIGVVIAAIAMLPSWVNFLQNKI